MGTRDLFDKGTPYKILKSSDLQKATEKVESGRNVRAKVEERSRFVPRIDYSDPNNFVRFGSAEKYYEDAFDRITDTFPYDGSEAEMTEFSNSSSYFDLYILEKQYPRTTGYVTLCHGSYTVNSAVGGWGTPSSTEYIVTKGGPHTASGGMAAGSLGTQFAGANYYDTDIYNTDREYQGLRYGTRESNLRFHLGTGVSVEFWINKNGWDTSLTEKETVFDLWNGEASSSADYGRLLVYLTASGHGDEGKYPFRVHLASGSSVWDMQFGENITTSSLDGNWNHVGFSFQSSSADAELKAKFFHGGAYIESTASSDMTFGEVTGSLQSFIGGLRTTPSGNAYDGLSMEGSARLSASLDEFRYWKDYRTAEDIGLNFFRQVRGGSNTDVSNAGLGVYYKFNEGITGTDSLDSIVLDYSGRISNGNWINYPGSLARNTGSAMVSASALVAEFEDPVIRPEYPTLKTRRSDFIQSGSVFDYTNNSTLYNRLPAWIIDEDPGTLKQMLQIVGSYADSLHLQLEELPRLKDATYASSSNKTVPIANRLVANYGMQAPEIFADASILAEFMSRDEKRNFDLDLGEVKNRIYKNIYNNLVYIYKSKGTLKSFRNLIRCFGVGDEVVRLNLYGNNVTYKVRDNYDPVVSRKNYANFNHPDSFSGVVTQQSRSSNSHASNVTFVSGTVGPYIPTTAEIDVIFPKKVGDRGNLSWFSTTFLSSSIFGTHRLKTAGDENCYVQAATADDYSWGLYAVRPDLESSDAYLVFKSNQGTTPEFYLTTSVYPNLYDNQRWNFAVRTKNVKYPVADGASGSSAGSATDYDIDDTYLKLELYGVNYESGLLKNEFTLTSSALTASAYLTADHRYYMGAARTNWTGSVVAYSDVRASSLRHWESYLENEAVRAHARDPKNFGSLRPYRSTFLLQTALTGTWVPEMETLALHWDFDNVTGSDSSGEFLVDDFSSGSTGKFDRYHDNENNPQFSKTVGYQYPGQAYNMRTSSTGAVDRAYIDGLRQNAPETLSSQDTISILSRQDDIEFTRDTRPINYYFSFEKSMYATITQEIMNFFGTVVEFNDLIGDPKNRYRQDYKELEKLRELFFERVGNTPDLDKYIEYYKWIDNSLSVMLQQLVPATADFSDGIRTMVESHALERNKYWNKFPTLEMKVTDPEAAVHGITELKYNWKYGHAPIEQFINNKSIAFNGVNGQSQLTVGDDDSLSFGADGTTGNEPSFSWSAWVKPTGDLSLFGDAFFIVSKVLTGGSGDEYAFGHVPGAGLTFLIADGSGFSTNYIAAGNVTLTVDEWQHVCGTYDGSRVPAGIKIYLNGVVQATANTSPGTYTAMSNAAADLVIGRRWSGLTTNVAEGFLDEIAAFDKELSSTEVSELYDSAKALNLETFSAGGNLVSWWRMGDKATGTSPDYTIPDQIGSNNGTMSSFQGDSTSGVVADAVSAKVNTDKNCLWWHDRAERTNPNISSSVASVNVDRDKILTITETYRTGSPGPTLAKSTRTLPTTTYQGSTFALRRFDEIYNFIVDEEKSIKSGPSFSQRKRFGFTRGALSPFASDSLAMIRSIESEKNCNDALVPPEIDKKEVSSKYLFQSGDAGLGGNDYTAEGIGEIYAPFSVFSSSVTTGYQADVPSGAGTMQHIGKVGLDNYHHDVYGGDMEVPMQGPFTEKYVGGNQYRHIGLVNDPALTSSATRPEAWNLGITTGGTLTLQSRRMTTTYANSRRPEASLTRDEVAKRPVNIRNIQMTASDVGAYKTTLPAGTSTDIGPAQTEFISGSLRSNIGNFEHFYDIIQTSGRDINNVYFVDNEGISASSVPSIYVDEIVDYVKPQRGKHEWVFVERFSAPGGPETAGDANGGYCLDLESGQYSPYNALPYRNLTVRTPLERILLVDHANQFGFFSNVQDRGGSGASTVSAADYSGTGSYQKVNRNTLRRPQLSGTTTWGPLAGLPTGDAVTLTASVYDNGYVTHEIPQMELSYAWISASYTGSLSYGHGSPDGLLSTSAGIVSSINFVSSSDFVSYNDSGVRDYGGDYINFAAAAASPIPQTRHLNTNIVEPMTASEAILGHQIVTSSGGNTTPIGYYVNYGDIDTAPDTTTITDSFIQQVNVGVQPVTASVLHDVLIHRDGYYGYPSWKQTRTGEHQLVRHYRKNNTITINHTPGGTRYYKGVPPLTDRFGSLQTFTEPPVDKSSKPLQFVLGIQSQVGIETDGTPRMEVKQVVVDASYGNETVRFSNRALEELVSVNPNTIYTAYDRIKEAYLNGALNDPTTPVKEFVSLRYGQVVYPASYNAGMEMIRERQNFKVKFWNTTRAKRTTLGFEKSSSMGAPYFGLFNQLTQSAWALDASQIFLDGAICTASNASSSAGGELQNDYLMVHNGAKQFITASALYARKHMLFATMSTTCITLDNPQTGSVTNTVDPVRRQGDVQIYSGDAFWEADRLAGTIETTIVDVKNLRNDTIKSSVTSFVSGVREPIDPDYESNMKDAILQSQEYSIIPEFRISEHIDKYLKNGVGDWLADNPRMFEIFGASGTLPQNSSGSDFYKIFSNSDFMRRFETIYTDHVGFKSPAKITLRCKAIKKFLPYDGFYPAQRTLDLASQFSQSYARFVNVKGGIDFASPATDGRTYPKAALRPFLQPFYSPGIMYNTIKSGIAVDFGMYSGSYEVVNNSGSAGGGGEIFMIGRPISIDGKGRGPGGTANGFDNRVPFEALVSPADYISNMTFVDMEPHPSASMNMTASWDGSGDPLYEMMINNFLAESVNMFLPGGQMSTIISAKENDFRNFQPNKVYAMRIRLRKSYNQERTYEASSGKTTYPIPQVTPEERASGLRETFTMYSRPTAFGPPLAGRDFETVKTAVIKMDSLQGYNPAYTPPYYDGEAWCDILFKATYPKHTLDEILSDAHIVSMRVDGSEWTKAGSGVQDTTKPYNSSNVDGYAMQITASINVDGKAKVNSVEYKPDGTPVMIVDDPASTQNVWVIQPKFETPMLNFSPTSGSLRPITEAQGNLTMPANGKETVPRGMWHQFGLFPDADDKGIFMEISDIGSDWARNKVPTFSGDQAADYYQTELLTQGKSYFSLADQMKFNKTGIKLGQIAESFEVSEAIIAIPFIEDGGVRKFFEIPKVTVETYRQNLLNPASEPSTWQEAYLDPAEVVGDSIKNQLDLMSKYVIPPKFNFMEFDSVDPIAMYIFEFKHTFDKDDLTYMWQNLPPKAASKIEIVESTVSHPLLTNELMGATARDTGRALQSEVKWMVFKVKQRANWNYYSKVLSRVGGDTGFSFNFKMGGAETEVSNVKYSYNWPYDFFSLIEFANIEAQVDIEDTPPVPNPDFLPEH